MNATLLKAVALLVPAGSLLLYSIALSKRKAPWSALQLLGAACLVVVVLTHICEALRLFPWMGWGSARSAGHYLDLSGAILGLTLFPAAYVLRAVTKRRA
jgi:succinate dehydrogenase/fumarate reductase cytochrome b subunit